MLKMNGIPQIYNKLEFIIGSEESSTFFFADSIFDANLRVGHHFANFLKIEQSCMRKVINNQVIGISGNSIQRTNFTLGEKTEAYFGCSVVYKGETLILGGKKEPNQVCFFFYCLKIYNLFKSSAKLNHVD